MNVKDVKNDKSKNDIYIPNWFYDDDRNIIVAEKLLYHVIEMQKNHRSLTITYKELSETVNCDLTPRTIEKFLGNISDVCKENQLPYISGIVVNAESLIPGVGYFKCFYGINSDDLESQIKQFEKDYKNISECNFWQDLLDKLHK